MADDQRPQDHTPDGDANIEEARADEQDAKPRGLGRLTARFRRRTGASEAPPEQDPQSEIAADDTDAQTTTPEDADRPNWLIPAGADPTDAEESEADPDAEQLDELDEPESVLSSTAVDEGHTPIHATESAPSDQTEPAPEPDLSEDAPKLEEPAGLDAEPESESDPNVAGIEPETEFEETAAAATVITPMPEGIAARTRPRLNGMTAHLVVLTGLATIAIMGYLLIEPSPRWMLLLGAAAVVFGLDGTLRQTWRAPFSLGQETAPYLFVPALYMLGVPVLIEHNVSGELVLFVGLGASVGFGALAWAEVASVRPQAAEYDQARLLVTANTYLTGFAIFSLSYVFEISLAPAIVATAIAASMLAVEVLREGEIDPMETLGLSLVTGVVLGELRWLLYYVPLDTYLAGLTLLLAFYLATGLLHSHVIRALNRAVAAEYGGIAAAGLALVVVARAAGLA